VRREEDRRIGRGGPGGIQGCRNARESGFICCRCCIRTLTCSDGDVVKIAFQVSQVYEKSNSALGSAPDSAISVLHGKPQDPYLNRPFTIM